MMLIPHLRELGRARQLLGGTKGLIKPFSSAVLNEIEDSLAPDEETTSSEPAHKTYGRSILRD